MTTGASDYWKDEWTPGLPNSPQIHLIGLQLRWVRWSRIREEKRLSMMATGGASRRDVRNQSAETDNLRAGLSTRTEHNSISCTLLYPAAEQHKFTGTPEIQTT